MSRSDRLRAEDRRDFERVLDQALKSPQASAVARRTGATENIEQLRTRALREHGAIMAAALPEYRHYRQVRTQAARQAEPPSGSVGKNRRGAGRGLLGAVGFLVPVLAAMAAVVFLVFGYGLRLAGDGPGLADGLVTAGWIAGALAGLATLAGLVGMLVAAARNRAAAYADHVREADPTVETARQAWHQALLERGMLPHLHNRLPGTSTPEQLGRPTAPGCQDTVEGRGSVPEAGPGFSSPGFSSPDFAGPRSRPEEKER
ncbi:hypothetical protein [Streptomyces sp. NPDC048295]|uniref:hypothetical protein n=1 Tax=Streptomyces sp. NPDC048295 TaxID=3154617 RepID=UPI00343B4F24